jgi:hypothetical protein
MSRHEHDAMVVFIYIAEAHFVERDDQDNYVDGWPIGYGKELEFPQHKSIDDRMSMARYSMTKFKCLSQSKYVYVEPFDNPLHRYFGVWPEACFVVNDGVLTFRGNASTMGLPGMRNDTYGQQLDNSWSTI